MSSFSGRWRKLTARIHRSPVAGRPAQPRWGPGLGSIRASGRNLIIQAITTATTRTTTATTSTATATATMHCCRVKAVHHVRDKLKTAWTPSLPLLET